jgi:hypothetical protein
VTAATAWRFALLVASAKSNAARYDATPSSSQAADLRRPPDQEVTASSVMPEGACPNRGRVRECGILHVSDPEPPKYGLIRGRNRAFRSYRTVCRIAELPIREILKKIRIEAGFRSLVKHHRKTAR